MSKNLFVYLQHRLPQRLLTRFAGWMAERRQPWLKNFLIKDFIHRYAVDMSIAQSERLEDYPCFNAFFTRALKTSARPVATEEDILVSPVDGCISQIGRSDHDTLLQAKGSYYSVNALLGGTNLHFHCSHFATFYLSPKDYHRVHMPFSGRLTHTVYIPGKLFSVNPTAAEMIPNLFTENERLVCIFDTILGPMAVILIGAMLVGKIETTWGLVERTTQITTRRYSDHENIFLAKGAELGRFIMGSSVIVLLGKDKIQWLPGLQEKSPVQMGQAIAAAITAPA